MRVASKGVPAFLAPVEKVVGQYVYVAGGRFHVLDDAITETTWRVLIDEKVHQAYPAPREA